MGKPIDVDLPGPGTLTTKVDFTLTKGRAKTAPGFTVEALDGQLIPPGVTKQIVGQEGTQDPVAGFTVPAGRYRITPFWDASSTYFASVTYYA
jgi:hypothetical protein